MTRDELLENIKQTKSSIYFQKEGLKTLKSRVTSYETELIQSKLNLEELQEQLRKLDNSTVSVEVTERDLEIARFKLVAPAIIASLPEKNNK